MLEQLVRNSYLWALVLELTKTFGFQILKPPSQENEPVIMAMEQDGENILLFRNHGRKYELIRVQTVDYIWPAMLARDIRYLADEAPRILKRLKASQLTICNIYLLHYPYGEMLEDVLADMQKIEEDKCTIHSGIMLVDMLDLPQIKADFAALDLDRNQLVRAIQEQVVSKSIWEMKDEVEREERRKEQEFKQIFHYGRPIFTYLILGINLCLFAFLEWVGSSTDISTLITYGAKWNPSIKEGEYWRFITPMFLHIGLLHIVFNSLALYFLGNLVERIYGSKRFLWIYFVSGFMGVAASFAFTDNVSAGASGAIFGCFGAMLYFGLKRRDLFFRTIGSDIIFVLLFNLGIGALVPMIDNYAHVGGLVGGFLAAMMVNLPRQRQVKERLVALFTALILSGLMIQIGFVQELDSPHYHIIQAELEMKAENWSEASSHLARAIQLGSEQAEVYLQLGMLYNQLEKFPEAEQQLMEAQRRGNDQAELYFHLAYAQLKQHKLEEGRLNLLATIERDPQIAEAYYNLALIYVELNQREKALEVIEQAEQLQLSPQLFEELQQKILERP